MDLELQVRKSDEQLKGKDLEGSLSKKPMDTASEEAKAAAWNERMRLC